MTDLTLIIPILDMESIDYFLSNLLNQSLDLKDLEIICILSNNKCYNVLKKHCSSITNFKIVSEYNTDNMAKLKNIGLKNATSKYVMFVNPFYFYETTFFEKFLNVVKNNDLDLVHNVMEMTKNKDDNLFNKETTSISGINKGSIEDVPEIFRNTSLYSTIFNLEYIKENDMIFDEECFFEDLLFLFELYVSSSKLGVINEKYYVSNIAKMKTSRSINYEDVNSISKIFDMNKKMLKISTEKNISDCFIKEFLLGWVINFLNGIPENNISTKRIEQIFDQGYELFKEIENSDLKLPASYSYLFENIIHNESDVVKLFDENRKYDVRRSEIPFIDEINVAVIMDPFSYNSFSSEFNIIPLEPDNWKQQFENNRIDLFICESTWKGVGFKNIKNGIAIESDYNPWENKIAVKINEGTGNESTILNILSFCNENDIPSIFWNKEDPTSFDRFIDIALNFDYIFTTDENSVVRYKARGHNNVHTLLFASQIKLFNPIEYKKRSNDVIFAGSWYKEFINRCNIMENMFNKILRSEFSLKIYDRQSGSLDTSRHYPKKYLSYVNLGRPFNEMPAVYKESKIALNVNTITESNTMFSRRIFELMSSNTFVISNYSKGIDDLFGNNVLYLDKEKKLSLNKETIDEICNQNLYDVLENHTYYQRFKYILNIIGFNYKEKRNMVHIIYDLTGKAQLNDCLDDFYSFKYNNKKCIILHGEKKNIDEHDVNGDENQLIFLNKLKFLEYIEKLSKDDFLLLRDIEKKLHKDFFKKAFLHYQYLGKEVSISENLEKYHFNSTKNCDNILINYANRSFVSNKFNNNKDNMELIVYSI